MKKKMTTVTFTGTPEQEQKLDAIIEKYGKDEGAIMRILQDAQEVYGYLPIEVQKMISVKTGVPLAEIYGVATFYSQFSLNPKGKVAISVCLGTACYVKVQAPLWKRFAKCSAFSPAKQAQTANSALTLHVASVLAVLPPLSQSTKTFTASSNPQKLKTYLLNIDKANLQVTRKDIKL